MRLDSKFIPVILFLFLGCLLAKDLHDAATNPLVDLRNRVVGARVLKTGISPYTYRWHPGDPASLLNPYDLYLPKYSFCTATPAFLHIIQPLAALDYRTIKLGWTILSFFFVVWILLRLFIRKNIKVKEQVILGIISILFLLGNNWRQSVIQGQYYVLFPFLVLFAHALTVSKKRQLTTFIVMVGIASLFRPILLLVMLPLIINPSFYSSVFKGFLITCGIVGVYFMVTGQSGEWKGYSSSSGYWLNYYKTSTDSFKTAPQINQYWAAQGKTIPEEPGTETNTTDTAFSSQLSSQALNLTQLSKAIMGKPLPLSFCMLSWMLLAGIIIGWMIWKRKNTIEDCLLGGFLLYYLLEILLPVPKNSYCFPEILLPLSLLWQLNKINTSDLYIIVGYLFIMCIPARIFPLQLVCMEFFIMGTLIYCYLKPTVNAEHAEIDSRNLTLQV